MASRTVVVTGGGRGIGAAITRAFLEAGDRVVIASRTAPDGPLAREARAIRCDVRRPSELQAAIDGVAADGPIDVLVSNAGSSAWRPLGEVDEAFWDEMIALNLKSVLFGAQAVARHMPAGGSIVNVSSLAGKRGSANNAVYCAAKFGVTGITQALAKELGPRGIRVNAVCPVYVRTPGLEAALRAPVAPPRGGDVSAYLDEFARTQSALGRLPTADEVGRACVFLASDAASAITGQSVNVDCGVLPQ
jgi:3-oxoacyl-[acyl-carrier protein] reductase/meso-butanediol dehydrogenase/(S,S)-butanediol dehydrogenase/diacetyl reductase